MNLSFRLTVLPKKKKNLKKKEIFTMNQPSQQDINHLVEITLRFIRTKQLKYLDEHIAENANDPNSVWRQIGVNFFGASVENDSHSIKVYWFTDVLGYNKSVNERLSNYCF